MPPLKPNHNPIFKLVLTDNIKAACKDGKPDEDAIREGIRQTIQDFELVPIMTRDVLVSGSGPDIAALEVSFGGSLKHLLDRGRLGFYKGKGIEEFIAEKGVEF